MVKKLGKIYCDILGKALELQVQPLKEYSNKGGPSQDFCIAVLLYGPNSVNGLEWMGLCEWAPPTGQF